jgi:hypothetical protein
VDAELGSGIEIGGYGGEVLCHGLLIAELFDQPGTRRARIGHGFLGGEALGADDEQRGLGVQFFQGFGKVRAVHVGDETRAQLRASIRFEGFAYHQRAEVGAADADVDDVADLLAGMPAMPAAAHRIGETAHQPQYALYIGHDILAVHVNGMAGAVAQRGMQGGAPLGEIDLLAAEHAPDRGGQPGLYGQGHQQLDGFIGDAVLGVIEQQVAELQREFAEARRVVPEHPAHVQRFDRGMVRLECLPGRR